MQAIELHAEIDENSEIHIRLPEPHPRGLARVIVLLESERFAGAPSQDRHRPSERLAWQGAVLYGDDLAPAFSPAEWGSLSE